MAGHLGHPIDACRVMGKLLRPFLGGPEFW